MMKIRLVGMPDTKRTLFFLKAAKEMGVPVEFSHVQDCEELSKERSFIKLDPWVYKSSDISEMDTNIQEYIRFLQGFEESGHLFFNEPSAICSVLNKRSCKEILFKNGIPITKVVGNRIEDREQLHEIMRKQHLSGVFLKPVYGSGAAAVLAYKFNHRRNQQLLYTSVYENNGHFYNTRNLRLVEKKEEIDRILNGVLKLDMMAERWYPKAKVNGFVYDLRVVVQFGQISYMIVRQSKGPITNLQLNHAPAAIDILGFDQKRMKEIKQLCLNTMALFPGLRYAGIDVLIAADSGKPYIVEVNGQGDLIYQDIYDTNKIYKEQVCYAQKRAAYGSEKGEKFENRQ